jgi:hypothetical protein
MFVSPPVHLIHLQLINWLHNSLLSDQLVHFLRSSDVVIIDFISHLLCRDAEQSQKSGA